MNIPDVYQAVRQGAGLPTFTLPNELTPEQREKLYDATANYIIANPTLFNANQIEYANKRRTGGLYGVPIEGYTVGDAVSDFTTEVGNQVVDLNKNLNPFSEQNRRGLYITVVAGLLVYFLAPVIIKSFLEVAKSKKSPAPSPTT